jgi:hypothetical protein
MVDGSVGNRGENMMKNLVLIAALMVFAGTASAQVGYQGSINNANTIGNGGDINGSMGIGNGGGLNGSGSINPPHPGSGSSSAGAPVAYLNVDTKNPGEYVPSTFTNFKEAVVTAEANSHIKPLTLADLARQTQMEKKAAIPGKAIVMDQDSEGKLIITNRK